MSNVVFYTNGKGLWSNHMAAVTITDMELRVCIDEAEAFCGDEYVFGELRVQFSTEYEDDWDIEYDGLIYTDPRFLKELRAFLNSHGLPGKSVYYSEQGMQGNDYVSLDADKKFYMAWKKLNLPNLIEEEF